ncbi:hypothetical protein ACTNEN_09595 [Oribacterium sp. HCP28S3_H8]|jgi:hypothetical protein
MKKSNDKPSLEEHLDALSKEYIVGRDLTKKELEELKKEGRI